LETVAQAIKIENVEVTPDIDIFSGSEKNKKTVQSEDENEHFTAILNEQSDILAVKIEPGLESDENDRKRKLDIESASKVLEVLQKKKKTTNWLPGVKYSCENCGESFEYKCHLQIHINKVHLNVKTYDCELCQKPFVTKNELDQHFKRIHLRSREFSCVYCNYSGCLKSDLQKHMIRKHSMAYKRESKLCGIPKPTQKVPLKNNVLICQFEINENTICGAPFEKKELLEAHINTVHQDPKLPEILKCQFETSENKTCGTPFENKEELENHVNLVHSKINSSDILNTCEVGYKCDYCNLSFATESVLIEHVKECAEAQKSLLEKPSVETDQVRKFQCKVCNITFSSMAWLKMHMKKHLTRRE